MSKHTVYLSTGEIIEYTGPRAKFRRMLAKHMQSQWLSLEPIRYWFRPCDAWIRASEQSLELWRRKHRTLLREAGL